MAERGRLAHVFAHLSVRPQNVPGNEWVLAANSIMPPEIDGNHLRLKATIEDSGTDEAANFICKTP
jgi:hypothetical protein